MPLWMDSFFFMTFFFSSQNDIQVQSFALCVLFLHLIGHAAMPLRLPSLIPYYGYAIGTGVWGVKSPPYPI